MKLTLDHTTTGWFESTGDEVAWFHYRRSGQPDVRFGAVCMSGDDHRALGSPETITITIEAA